MECIEQTGASALAGVPVWLNHSGMAFGHFCLARERGFPKGNPMGADSGGRGAASGQPPPRRPAPGRAGVARAGGVAPRGEPRPAGGGRGAGRDGAPAHRRPAGSPAAGRRPVRAGPRRRDGRLAHGGKAGAGGSVTAPYRGWPSARAPGVTGARRAGLRCGRNGVGLELDAPCAHANGPPLHSAGAARGKPRVALAREWRPVLARILAGAE
jgi:hypothetical protein